MAFFDVKWSYLLLLQERLWGDGECVDIIVHMCFYVDIWLTRYCRDAVCLYAYWLRCIPDEETRNNGHASLSFYAALRHKFCIKDYKFAHIRKKIFWQNNLRFTIALLENSCCKYLLPISDFVPLDVAK